MSVRLEDPEFVLVTVRLVWPAGSIPGRTELIQHARFDGTPEVFEHTWEQLRRQITGALEDPMRPCGFPGPWWKPEGAEAGRR